MLRPILKKMAISNESACYLYIVIGYKQTAGGINGFGEKLDSPFPTRFRNIVSVTFAPLNEFSNDFLSISNTER